MSWHVPVLHYCFGRSVDHWFGGSLVGVMHAPLHVLVALLCSTYRTFHVACLFRVLWRTYINRFYPQHDPIVFNLSQPVSWPIFD